MTHCIKQMPNLIHVIGGQVIVFFPLYRLPKQQFNELKTFVKAHLQPEGLVCICNCTCTSISNFQSCSLIGLLEYYLLPKNLCIIYFKEIRLGNYQGQLISLASIQYN